MSNERDSSHVGHIKNLIPYLPNPTFPVSTVWLSYNSVTTYPRQPAVCILSEYAAVSLDHEPHPGAQRKDFVSLLILRVRLVQHTTPSRAVIHRIVFNSARKESHVRLMLELNCASTLPETVCKGLHSYLQ